MYNPGVIYKQLVKKCTHKNLNNNTFKSSCGSVSPPVASTRRAVEDDETKGDSGVEKKTSGSVV